MLISCDEEKRQRNSFLNPNSASIALLQERFRQVEKYRELRQLSPSGLSVKSYEHKSEATVHVINSAPKKEAPRIRSAVKDADVDTSLHL
ncbi:hypothetical protein SUGI_0922380 [Cryptomeria japonica]|nr:hypothetical protein SUGI_0922380 [Cryptomeria japonica]